MSGIDSDGRIDVVNVSLDVIPLDFSRTTLPPGMCAGDVVTIDGRYEVDPRTGQTTERLQRFVLVCE